MDFENENYTTTFIIKSSIIVARAYVKWLVNHLVQMDVLDAQIAVDKFSKEIKYLKGDMVSQGELRAVRYLSSSAKKVSDKALVTKN